MTAARVLSVNVGLPKDVSWRGTARCSPPWPARSPWPSPSMLSRRTIAGPFTGCFHAPVWTVLCIGDRYRIGEAEFEVTQPGVTCYRVGMRLGEPELPALLVSHHRPGFYLRVIREGHVEAGDDIVRTRTGPGALTVAATDALLYLPGRDPAKLRVATEIPRSVPAGSSRSATCWRATVTTPSPPGRGSARCG